MPDFINTVDVIGDEVLTDMIIDRTVSEYCDNYITSIGSYIFYGCTSLTTANFPAATNIGDLAFYDCSSLTKVNFPLATSIGSNAFGGCRSLTSISFPACTRIGNSAFYNCSSLTEISFPAVTYIGNTAFTNCSSLTTVNFPEVTIIDTNAFYSCSSLTEANFPAVAHIGNSAFYRCSSLTSISFPVAASIGGSAFYACTKLTEANFPMVKFIGQAVFSNCSRLTTANFPAATTIGTSAFDDCSSLTEVSFPVATLIGSYAFRNCDSIASLTETNFPVAKTIGNAAFWGCSPLTTVNFPAVTSIGSNAFQFCSSLTTANFPAVTYVSVRVFDECHSLTTLYLGASTVATLANANAFTYTPMSDSSYTGAFGSIYVPGSLVAAYKSATNWATYADRITNIVGIGSNEDLTVLYSTSSNISIGWYGPMHDPSVTPTNVSVVSSDDTVVTINSVSTTSAHITFNATSLEKEGVATITVTCNIGDGQYSTSFDITVIEKWPEYSYSVEAVSGASYGFALNSNEYYESQNKGENSTAAVCKVNLTIGEPCRLYLDCINYGETSYDYGLLSKLDTTLSTSINADSTDKVFKSFKSLQSANVVTVDYGEISVGEHFIYCKYIKDNSQANGNDSLQFKVRLEAV